MKVLDDKQVTNIVIQLILCLLSAMLVAYFTYIFNKYQSFKEKNEVRLSVLSALSAELTELLSLISSREKSFLEDVDNGNESPFSYIPISLNYFSVYENISTKFGLIKNQDLIKIIIRTYSETKGLFEDVKNLEYLSKKGYGLFVESPKSYEQLNIIITDHKFSVDYIIKTRVPMVKDQISNCIKTIEAEKQLIKSKNTFMNYLLQD